jgi:hypothetical protein
MSDKKKTKDTTVDATKDTTVDETQKSKETKVNIYKRLNYHVSCGCILYWETISLSAIITHF